MLCTASPLGPRHVPASLPFASSSNTLDVIRLTGRRRGDYAKTDGSAPLTRFMVGKTVPAVKVSVDGQDVILIVE